MAWLDGFGHLMALIECGGVTVLTGGRPLLERVTFSAERGEHWGVLGRNGSGKTTLLRVLTGDIATHAGAVVRSSGLRIAWMDQHRDFGSAVTVWDVAAAPFAALREQEESLARQADALAHDASPSSLDRYSRDQERFDRAGGYSWHFQVDAVLHGLGFEPDEARSRVAATLSGGEQGRLHLARQLVQPADILLLDEPTNHLDLETTDWLATWLAQSDVASILVSHDRDFLDRVTDHILHLEGGTALAYAAGYRRFLEQRTAARLAEERALSKQENAIAAEEDYIRRNIAGGNSRQAKGRRRRLARLPRLGPLPSEEEVMAFRLHPGTRSGDQVLVTDRLSLVIDGKELVRDFSTRVTRGERIGCVGPNGAGKTTLLRTLIGERHADGGTVTIGASVKAAWYRQDLAQVPLDQTLYDIIQDRRPRWNRGQVQGHLGRFGFSGDSVLRKAVSLSGGERARIALALLMLSEANLLLLDEPSNHLDIESIEVLEDALCQFPGTILLVSHDRTLLRTVTDRTWSFADGQITDYPGGFEEWEVVAEAQRIEAADLAQSESARRKEVRQRDRSRGRESGASDRNRLRAVRRDLQQAEAEVHDLEKVIERLTAELAAPELYESDDGPARAGALAARLSARKADLESALERWSIAGERMAALEQAQGRHPG